MIDAVRRDGDAAPSPWGTGRGHDQARGALRVAVVGYESVSAHYAYATGGFVERIGAPAAGLARPGGLRLRWRFERFSDSQIGPLATALNERRFHAVVFSSGCFQTRAFVESEALLDALRRHLEPRGPGMARGGLVVLHPGVREPCAVPVGGSGMLELSPAADIEPRGSRLRLRPTDRCSLLDAPNRVDLGSIRPAAPGVPWTLNLSARALFGAELLDELELDASGWHPAVLRVAGRPVYLATVPLDWLGEDELLENVLFAAAAPSARLAVAAAGHVHGLRCEGAVHLAAGDVAPGQLIGAPAVRAFGSVILDRGDDESRLDESRLDETALVARLERGGAMVVPVSGPSGRAVDLVLDEEPGHVRAARAAAAWVASGEMARLTSTMTVARAYAECVAAAADSFLDAGEIPRPLRRDWFAAHVIPAVRGRIRNGSVAGARVATAAANRCLEVAGVEDATTSACRSWLAEEHSAAPGTTGQAPSSWERAQVALLGTVSDTSWEAARGLAGRVGAAPGDGVDLALTLLAEGSWPTALVGADAHELTPLGLATAALAAASRGVATPVLRAQLRDMVEGAAGWNETSPVSEECAGLAAAALIRIEAAAPLPGVFGTAAARPRQTPDDHQAELVEQRELRRLLDAREASMPIGRRTAQVTLGTGIALILGFHMLLAVAARLDIGTLGFVMGLSIPSSLWLLRRLHRILEPLLRPLTSVP